MGANRTTPTLGRRFVGAPRIWVGVAYLGVGLGWMLLALIDGPSDGWRWVFGALWLVLGGTTLVIAVRDKARGRGHYKNPEPPSGPS